MGALILDEVIKTLLNREGFGVQDELILAGSR
jgi:hypothetical protein